MGRGRPVAESMFFSFIHLRFSSSTSGHSCLNFAPPSPALMLPACDAPVFAEPDVFVPPPVLFHHLVRCANSFRSASDALTLPVVISSLVIKLSRPFKIVLTSHAGLKLLGWKSEMLRQSRLLGWKRPEGVCMRIAGGAKG